MILIAGFVLTGAALMTLNSHADVAVSTPGAAPEDLPDVTTTGSILKEPSAGHVMVATPVPTMTPISRSTGGVMSELTPDNNF